MYKHLLRSDWNQTTAWVSQAKQICSQPVSGPLQKGQHNQHQETAAPNHQLDKDVSWREWRREVHQALVHLPAEDFGVSLPGVPRKHRASLCSVSLFAGRNYQTVPWSVLLRPKRTLTAKMPVCKGWTAAYTHSLNRETWLQVKSQLNSLFLQSLHVHFHILFPSKALIL